MNAEQWMELAINGRVSQVLIPMGFQPTLPELYCGIDGWRVRFFFYGMSLYGGVPALETPAYRLEFSLDTRHVVTFDALTGGGMPLAGDESLSESVLEERQQNYLSELDQALTDPDHTNEGLYTLWLAAHPEQLAQVLAQLTQAGHETEQEGAR